MLFIAGNETMFIHLKCTFINYLTRADLDCLPGIKRMEPLWSIIQIICYGFLRSCSLGRNCPIHSKSVLGGATLNKMNILGRFI